MTDETVKKPKRTLLARVAELGPTHSDAYALLSKADPSFLPALRAALDAEEAVADETVALEVARQRVASCESALATAKAAQAAGAVVLARLDALASSIAHATGDVAEASPSE